MIKEINKNIFCADKKFALIDYKCNKRELSIEINDIEYVILREIRNYLDSFDSKDDLSIFVR